MSRVLLVDDQPGVLFTLREVLIERGHDVITATSGKAALAHVDDADVVLTDLSMPEMSGLELLAAITGRTSHLPVILLTAHGSERVAVQAVKAGAYDYLAKPFDIDEVALVIERALEARRLRADNRRLAAERTLGRRLIHDSKAMNRLLDAVERVAARDVTVLIGGETGTGKELVAQLLHAQSPRAARPLVRFSCAAIPEELAEAELFGHAKGAFTGAVATRTGFFAAADGGTLFLDEIGELSLAIQAKLLRALQEGEIQPVGASRIEKVNVRVIAATHRDLAAEVKAGRFREDLYYRLAVVELKVPALRERPEDIPGLVAELARHYGEKFGLGAVAVGDDLLAVLRREPWPGNVRQLENTIARLSALSSAGVLALADYQAAPAPVEPAEAADGPGDFATGPSLREQVEAFERGVLASALDDAGGNQSEAARRLRVSRVTLIDKLKKYRLVSRRP